MQIKTPRLIPVFILLLSACIGPQKEHVNFDSFPRDWVQLTEIESELVVFNSCDFGNLLITITKNNQQFELLLHGQQEDYDFHILEVMQLNDTIFLETQWKDVPEKQIFKFFWTDEEKGLGRFITTYSNGYTSENLFVTKDKHTNFKHFNQPCKECWGDECDDY